MRFYITLDGEEIPVDELPKDEVRVFETVMEGFLKRPDYVYFSNWWQAAIKPVRDKYDTNTEYTNSTLVKICEDMCARLGLIQGLFESGTPGAIDYIVDQYQKGNLQIDRSRLRSPYAIPSLAEQLDDLDRAGYVLEITKRPESSN